MSKRCSAPAKRGGRCKCQNALALQEDGTYLCVFHDPARRGRALAIQTKGGKVRWERRPATPPPPPTTLDEAIAYSSWLTHAVTSGHIDPRRAAEATRALGTFTRALKERDVAQRMAAIEAQLKALKTGHGDAEQPAKAPSRRATR